MSQIPYTTCVQCGTPIAANQSFCPTCGKPTQEGLTQTATPTPYPPPFNATPYSQYSQPNALPYPPYPNNTGPHAGNFSSGQTWQEVPSSPAYTPMPPGSIYGSMPTPPPPPPAKKRSPLFLIILGIVALVVVLGCAGTFTLINSITHASKSYTSNIASNGGSSTTSNTGSNSGGAVSNVQQINVTTVYASDQITFTSIQQAAKFSDDDFTTYSEHPNYVRVNFKEQQLAKESSFFSYTDSFRLILPDKTVVASQKAQQYTGPDQAVVRTNWVDFGTSAAVDLSQLTIRLGTQEEAQMDIPLKTGADVSKYQSKTTPLSKQTSYASMNWTLKNATQSLYFNGSQAKSGQVYITVSLIVNNSSSNDVFLYNFVRLKAGSNTVAPDNSSDTSNFDDVKAGTTNIQGSATFLVTPTGTYTLNFLANSDDSIAAQSVDFQLS